MVALVVSVNMRGPKGRWCPGGRGSMLRRPRRTLVGGVVRHVDGRVMPDVQSLSRARHKRHTNYLDNKQRFGRPIPQAGDEASLSRDGRQTPGVG